MARKTRAPTGQTTHDSVAIASRQKAVAIDLAAVESSVRRTIREIGLNSATASVCFLTDREMARLNAKYRGKKKTTDILSFPSEQRAKPKTLRQAASALRGEFLGDIAISPTVARRNAKRFARSMAEEIRILLLHGILHLMGYDHDNDGGEMERQEAKLRRRLRLE